MTDQLPSNWSGFGLTHIGRVRTINQDALALRNDLQLWVLADGMGGHAGGEVASRIAVEAIPRYVVTHQLPPSPQQAASTHDEQCLVGALEHANKAIREASHRDEAFQGMGTTVVAVRVVSGQGGDRVIVAHAGDSRLYLLRNGRLLLWTRDHTLLEERLDLGLIQREQMRTHPLKHILTKGLGIEPEVKPTVSSYRLEPQDLLLVCSDGLTKMLTDEEIQSLLNKGGTASPRLCDTLIQAANRLGGEDNTTVILIGKDDDRTIPVLEGLS